MYLIFNVFNVDVKVFNMITNGNCANSIVQLAIQIKNGIIKHVNMTVKIIVRAKNIIVGILAHVFVKMVSI